jgi:hypothetical protein
VGVCAGFLIALAGVWLAWRSAPSEPLILFLQEGVVWVEQQGGLRQLTAPDQLAVHRGSRLRTGSDSRAVLVPSPSVSALLEAETDLIVLGLEPSDSGAHALSMELTVGETVHQWGNSSKVTRYEVRAPAASVLLSPGECLISVLEDGETRVEVSEGSAQVSARDTKVQVQPGEYTSITPGRAPSIPHPVMARFVFVSERAGNADVWLLDEEGREIQLTHDSAADLSPAWSPGGTHIAFESWRDGNSEIYVMNADGSHQLNLTRDTAGDFAPSWSGDGQHIAFESSRDGQLEIYVMKADGSEPRRLTFGPGISLDPHWDGAGSEIIFSRIESDTNGDGAVDANDLAALFSVAWEGGTAYSTGGTRLVYDEMSFPWARRAVS